MQIINRRKFIRSITSASLGILGGTSILTKSSCSRNSPQKKPNILFAISDDQSWIHTGMNGCKIVNTPAFDRVAKEGVLFNNAFCAAPQCSPNRASILTGRHIWQNGEAGTHASNFPKKLQVFPDLLERAGYFVGFTGKPWGPGNWEITGWKRNPAGYEYNNFTMNSTPVNGINKIDYAGNFVDFLDHRPKNQPFCFWYGCKEPHRRYEKGSGLKAGKKLEDVNVPEFYPDVPEIRSDILDYAVEIDWFDKNLEKILKQLEEIGELENTIIVVTSDNGMPFPRAKANNYEYGIHMPLAVRWGDKVLGGRVVDDLISFADYAPTFLEAAGVDTPEEMTGKSFLNILTSNKDGIVDTSRKWILSGRERHTHARPDNLTYPIRAIRTPDYLYIWNVKPDRWPAGDPTGSGDPDGYHDIDASPTKTYLLTNKDNKKVKKYFELAVAKRPEEELYDIKNDPACINNLADVPEFKVIAKTLRTELEQALTEQSDPRMLGYGDVIESYPRYSRMRIFKGFKKRGEYNPEYQVKKK
jgi:N-sulfoglucosamine sulfohydrolase